MSCSIRYEDLYVCESKYTLSPDIYFVNIIRKT